MSIDNTVASWTSAQLLADIRRKGQIPSTSLDLTDDVLLTEASAVLWSLAGWAQQQAGDGRLSFSFDRSVVAALSGPYRAANEFLLPPNAVADTIQKVVWVGTDGQEWPLQLIDISEQPRYDSVTSNGTPQTYAMLEGRVRVYPRPVDGGIVRFYYQRRHPALCVDNTTNAPAVSSISDAGGGFTAFALTSASPFAAGQYVDLVNPFYPYRTIFADLHVGSSAGSTATLYVPYAYANAAVPAQMRLVRTGQIPFVQLPLELKLCLAEKVAANVIRSLGDVSMAAQLEQDAVGEMQRFIQSASPRSKADRKKIVNPFSLFRTMGSGRGRRFRGDMF